MTETKRRLKVFLCHAHSDVTAVRDLYRYLKREGVAVWLDKESLLPGTDWDLEIRRAVRESDAVIVCLSKKFNERGYRQKEVHLALSTAEEQPEGEIFIIPARLEECDIPSRLSKWHGVDLFVDGSRQRLIYALRARAESVGAELRRRSGGRSGKSAIQNKVDDNGDLPLWLSRASSESYIISTKDWPSTSDDSTDVDLLKEQSSLRRREFTGVWMDANGYVYRDATKLGQLTDLVERNLLNYLIDHPGYACNYALLYQVAYQRWDNGTIVEKRVDEIVGVLRKLIEIDPRSPQHIRQVPGVGYVFNS